MVLGREGPTIQMGGNFGKMIADLRRLPLQAERTLVAAGAGAGLAAAFNAPLSGVLFILEEMRPQFKYTFTSVQAVVIACGMADIAVRVLTGQGPTISILTFSAPPLASLWLFPIFGSVFGPLGLAFNRLLLWALGRFSSLTGWAAISAGAVVGGIIGLLCWLHPAAVGGGDELIPSVLATPMAASPLLLLFAARLGTTALSYGCGAPGGIFAPMLALGTLFGMAYGHLAQATFPGLIADPGVFAVAGMGAFFAATVRAPITGVALAIELTGNYEQILPLLLTCAAATIVAELLGNQPIYSVLLRRTLERSHTRVPSPAASAPEERVPGFPAEEGAAPAGGLSASTRREGSAPRKGDFRVAFLAPMPSELRPLVRAASLRLDRSGPPRVYRGRVGDALVVATTTGIGTRLAAEAAERMLDFEPVDHLIVVGIAGAVGPSLGIGDLVVPELVIDGESDKTYAPIPLRGLPARGLLRTSDDFVADPERVARLAERGVIALDMETASIAAVCARRGCPWSVVRAISDRAGELPIEIMGLVKPDGSPDARAAAHYILTHPRRLPTLLMLARDSGRAASAAALAAVRACREL
jgi:H+/Cl- antiporter ClcA/nucleoside phosphorylase